MNKIIVTILITAVSLFISPTIVNAHVLQSSGSIGAVLHIDPADDPAAGEPANFFFDFKDKNDKFKIENCQCIFTISKAGTIIYTEPMVSTSVMYTFPEKNIYKVKVNGVASDESFQEFNLEYDIRISKEVIKQK